MRTFKTSVYVLALAALTAPTSAFAQAEDGADFGAEDSAADEPAPAPPAQPEPEPAPEPAAAPAASGGVDLNLNTTAPAASVETTSPPPAAERPPAPRTVGGPDTGGAWEFGYSGYFRAPMRVGLGARDVVPEGSGSSTMHSPVIPDDQYLSWQNTAHNRREWAEMFFSVGNGIASGNLAIQGFQFTDASWANTEALFGISQGWVEINHDLGFENIRFNAKAGSFWSRYGMAGRYDAGEYDTFLFGRTHVMGATSRVDIDMEESTIGFEVGYGINRPNPQMFNRARFTNLAHGHVFFTPSEDLELSAHLMHSWASQEVIPQYPTVLPGSNCQNPAGAQCTVDPNDLAGGINGPSGVFGPEYPNGSLSVAGLDARIDFGEFGMLYAGYAYTRARNALVVGHALEHLHSFGGGTFNLGITDQYLESPFCPTQNSSGTAMVPNDSCSNGNGSINTILAQYELSLSNFDVFEGNQDLRFKLYGMLNMISVDQREKQFLQPVADTAGVDVNDITQDGTRKLKFGLDTEFFATDWVSAGLRADRLQPHSKVPEHSFTVISPRLTFRSAMVTREQITIQYSRYIYDQRECFDGSGNIASPADNPYRTGSNWDSLAANGLPARAFCVQPPRAAVTPDGFGAHSDNMLAGNRGSSTLRPDVNVIKIEASMWW